MAFIIALCQGGTGLSFHKGLIEVVLKHDLFSIFKIGLVCHVLGN